VYALVIGVSLPESAAGWLRRQAALEELRHDHRIALHRVNGELEAERAARLEILQAVDAHAAAMAKTQAVR
jgi:hypothetical protein